ncbi:hypothetical protein BSPWISOXPB_6795 [uncultured Gammaproteobacteria bacterium]|nr:hypothetical protein BSPWISOXPB_6795 [uncultured Gammaproteobacteria bacterium]
MFRQIPTILALSKPVKMHYLKAPTSKKLRIDAAGYQASIIDYCFENDIEFSIRAKMCQSLKDILVDKDNQWQPLVDKKGKAIDGQATFRMRHFMGDKGKVFDLIVQRSVVTGQVELDF